MGNDFTTTLISASTSESTLSIAFADLRSAIGFLVAWGGDSTNWSTDQANKIQDILNIGLRQAYYPPRLPGRQAHEWSWLRPTTTMTTTADDIDYDMPADFGGIEGDITYSDDNIYPPVEITGEARIRALHARSDTTGRVQLCAVRPKDAVVGANAQRFEMLVWPTPDATYTLQYRYIVLPDALSATAVYPYGGMAHAEMIRESCLAAAEMEMNKERGIHWAAFMERLAASVAHDQRANTPERFGYSDGRRGAGVHSRASAVTYNGVLYEG